MIKTIIIALLMFLFLVFIHELGHFLAAKISGIKVNEFAIGMGPTIVKKQKGETLYSLKILPIGGYCAMEGEEEHSDSERSFSNAHPLKKIFTVAAGPFMNFLVSIILYFVVIYSLGSVPTNVVEKFTDNSPAQIAGLLPKDIIISIDGNKCDNLYDIRKNLDKSTNDTVNVRVLRESETKDFKVKLQKENGSKYLGFIPEQKRIHFFESIKYAFLEFSKMFGLIKNVLISLLTGKIVLSNLSGPVGVVKELGNQAKLGVLNLLNFLAYISLNLGFFNLLPIPALDGSKILTSLYELVFRKKVNQKLEMTITAIGFFLLLGLIFVITLKDIVNIIK